MLAQLHHIEAVWLLKCVNPALSGSMNIPEQLQLLDGFRVARTHWLEFEYHSK